MRAARLSRALSPPASPGRLRSALRGARGERSGPAPLRLRLAVLVRRGRLDREIARAVHGRSDQALALRRAQLAGARSQQKTARHLRKVIGYAESAQRARTISAVVIDARAVRGGRRAISQLAERLERGAAVDARGMVLARVLLTDGRSPLFDPACERTIEAAIAEIHDALDGRAPAGAAPRT